MSEKLLFIEKQIKKQAFSKNMSCFIVFGSGVFNNSGITPQDTDICVVMKHRQSNLKSVTKFIFKYFDTPDYRIYIEDEVFSKLPFMDKGVGVMSLEYFSDGLCLFGENIFKIKLKEINIFDLKRSYLNKIFEYIVRVRETRYSPTFDSKHKLWHIQKYLTRTLIDMLLYKDIIQYVEIKNFDRIGIIKLAQKNNFFATETTIKYNNIICLYKIYDQVNLYLIKDFIQQ